MENKTPQKKPVRLSSVPIEEKKPSRLVEVMWWIIFIVPVLMTYLAFQSIPLIVGLIFARIVMVFVQKRMEPKSKKKEVKAEQKPEVTVKEKVNTYQNHLSPYIEEAKAEWFDLLKFLHIYDHEKEDKYLKEYRQLRGWDK